MMELVVVGTLDLDQAWDGHSSELHERYGPGAELPATLLLRPFNYNTLSTRVFELASLERLSEAAPAALLVMAVGLVAVILLARDQRDRAAAD